MAKLTLSDLANLSDEQTAIATLSANNLATEVAMEKTLSRDGTSPNTMNADLDMNSNQILNLPTPVNPTEPLRLQDLTDFNSLGTIIAFPQDATYVTLSTHSTLDAERVLTAGTGLTLTDGGAGSTITVAEDTTYAGNKLHPASSTDNAVARYDSTAGNIQNSGVIIDDTNGVTGVKDLTASGGLVVGFAGTPADDIIQVGDANFQATYAAGNPAIIWDSTDTLQYTRSTNTLTANIGGAAKFGINSAAAFPGTNDGLTLGSTTNQFSDLFLASGAVVNFANGNDTLTHSSGTLTHAGALVNTGDTFIDGLVALRGDISPSQITADQNDYSPTGLSTASTLRLSSDATRNITGLAGGSDGRLITIHNVGATNSIVLKDESASSTAANRFALISDLTLSPDQCCVLQYDSTSSRWRCLNQISTTSSPSGTRVLLNTLTASASASLEDTTSLTATYNRYEIVFQEIVPATNSVYFRVRYQVSGSFQTTGYLSSLHFGQGSADGFSALTTAIPLTDDDSTLVTNSDPGINGNFFIINPSNAGTKHPMYGMSTWFSSTILGTGKYSGYYNTNGAVTGLQFTMSSGNITSGTIKIYGIVN